MKELDSKPLAPLAQPTLADLKEAEAAIRMMQQMLGQMHANKLSQSEAFREMMENYKYMHLALQEVRKDYQVTLDQRKKATRPDQGAPLLGRTPPTGPR